jgi:phage host-nuclease inhibitor protein Gam
MQAVEQIIVGDYIGSWLDCYREQLAFPVKSLPQFLSQCRQFGSIVAEFNRNVHRAQREHATKTPLHEHYIAQLEEFRDEYAAFLRAVESWAKGILNYLASRGATEHPTLWRLAPVNSVERVKPFASKTLAGT